MNWVGASAKGSSDAPSLPGRSGGPKASSSSLLQLGVASAVLALQLQMLPDCLIENAHSLVPSGT